MAEIEIGVFQTLVVRTQTDFGLYLGDEDPDHQVLLPRKYEPVDVELGDEIRVFVYTDSEDRPVATTQVPKATAGDFALLRVVDRNEHGAFLDWGLDKDLFAPRNEQSRMLDIGDELVFAVVRDQRDGRMKAASLLGPYLDYEVQHLTVGKKVDLLVFDHNDLGALVVVDGAHAGLVYRNESFQALVVGQRLEGYLKFVRADNKLDISLVRTGREAIDDAQKTLLEAIVEDGGFLPLHDKSAPEAIYARLSMSKKAFKKALGGLYKLRRVELTGDGVKLIDEG